MRFTQCPGLQAHSHEGLSNIALAVFSLHLNTWRGSFWLALSPELASVKFDAAATKLANTQYFKVGLVKKVSFYSPPSAVSVHWRNDLS